jgi:2,5-furandicarboxylate decarboxylase 1
MTVRDVREYLALLGEHGEAVTVDAEVDPNWEVGLLARRLMDRQGPAVVLRHVRGATMPVVMNLFSNRHRVALALGVEEQDLLDHWLRAIARPVPPVMVDQAPCQEMVQTGGELLADLPRIIWNRGDAGPYITFGLTISKDPDTQMPNLGIYRIQIKDHNRLGINAGPATHAGQAHDKAELQGDSLPVAVAIGGDPSLYLASQAPRSYPTDEVALAGALRGEAVPMVKCITVDLEVPAHAEIVLEGHYLAHTKQMEGPFGEFTGYYSGAAERGVIELTAITRRRDALFVATYEGKPPTNTHVLHSMAREPVWYTMLKRDICPTINDINVTYGGSSGLHVIVSMRTHREGHARNVGLELIKVSTIKHVVIVDEDIDVRDPVAVEWAIATRVQADRDIIIIPNLAGMPLDPSQPRIPTGLGAKMIVDATLPLGATSELVKFSPVDLEAVDRRWTEYGFPAIPGVGHVAEA